MRLLIYGQYISMTTCFTIPQYQTNIGGRRFKYYSFIFCCFVPVGVAAVSQTIKNRNLKQPALGKLEKFRKYSAAIICTACFVFMFALCENTYLLKYSKSDMPQYQFAEIMSQVEDATLLNYNFLDGGFYKEWRSDICGHKR